MSSHEPTIILNPSSGGGKGRKILPALVAQLKNRGFDRYVLQVTERPGDARLLSRKAVGEGTELILVAGGDGTVNEVVNGLFENRNPVNPECQLGIIHCGTGGGLAQTLHIPSSLPGQLDIIEAPMIRPIDVGCIVYHDNRGQVQERLFISECQMGLGGTVVRDVGTRHKHWGGTIAFGSVALSQLFHFTSTNFTIRADPEMTFSGGMLDVVIGNCSHCAGGMQLTPEANPGDGWLDLLLISSMTVPERLWNFSKIYSGNHICAPDFVYQQVRQLKIETEKPVLTEADGELLGFTPCEINVIPASVMIRCGEETNIESYENIYFSAAHI